MSNMDWREKLFGAVLVKCDSWDERLQQFATVRTREALAECAEPELEAEGAPPEQRGVELGVYFSFANISAASDDFPLRLERAHARVAPRLRLVQVVLWAHGDGGAAVAAAERERAFRASLTGKPWLAVPFHDVDTKRRLTRKYNIAVGVPALVVRGRHVRDALLADPLALRFPWPPPLLTDVLKAVPLQRCAAAAGSDTDDASSVLYSDLPEDAVRVFYFAAHWCPPCRAFTPSVCGALAAVRRRRSRYARTQLLVVSSDRSEESYRRTVSGVAGAGAGEALAVPWAAEGARRELAAALGVAGIPALVLLDPQHRVLTAAGRAALAADPDARNFPWAPRPVSVLTERSLLELARHPAVLLFVEDVESELEFAESVLGPAAAAYRDECSMRRPAHRPLHSDDDDEHIDLQYDTAPAPPTRRRATLFHVGVEGTGSAERLRERAGLDDAVPLLVGVDFPRRRLLTMSYGDAITTDSVQNFVDAFLSGSATFRPLQPHLVDQC